MSLPANCDTVTSQRAPIETWAAALGIDDRRWKGAVPCLQMEIIADHMIAIVSSPFFHILPIPRSPSFPTRALFQGRRRSILPICIPSRCEGKSVNTTPNLSAVRATRHQKQPELEITTLRLYARYNLLEPETRHVIYPDDECEFACTSWEAQWAGADAPILTLKLPQQMSMTPRQTLVNEAVAAMFRSNADIRKARVEVCQPLFESHGILEDFARGPCNQELITAELISTVSSCLLNHSTSWLRLHMC
ncbi:unnamed protein product [Pleuronectes platessa]|uniref:Uncharacterized protein n=1 Tax=Pleuronectes platessa TaxID=8262 RepID=A0A9N7YJT1_PLEPL|nr:unnamed protein product [Pleuronectes platessa]